MTSDTRYRTIDLIPSFEGADIFVHVGDTDNFNGVTFASFLRWRIKVAKTTLDGFAFVPRIRDAFFVAKNLDYIHDKFVRANAHLLLIETIRISGLSIYCAPLIKSSAKDLARPNQIGDHNHIAYGEESFNSTRHIGAAAVGDSTKNLLPSFEINFELTKEKIYSIKIDPENSALQHTSQQAFNTFFELPHISIFSNEQVSYQTGDFIHVC